MHAETSRKNIFISRLTHGSQGAYSSVMSSYESIYKKMLSPLEADNNQNPDEKAKYDPARHVAPIVAHELNNILTIVQGYAERLLLRHGQDAELTPHLRVISEASKRAAAVVRAATPPNANETFRQQSNSRPVPVAA
jgi:nitrogen-specific signal transduction histidine kinase